jgi:peroxin-3
LQRKSICAHHCFAKTRLTLPSLRRRFEQNQEDCSFTVLAILPTATENVLEAIPVENILDELQKHKAERLSRSVATSEIASSVPPSVTDDDSKSLTSLQSDAFVHASQITEGENTNGGGTDGGSAQQPKPKKSKAQLWNEMKISCKASSNYPIEELANQNSNLTGIHPTIYCIAPHAAHTNPAKPPWSPKLSG